MFVLTYIYILISSVSPRQSINQTKLIQFSYQKYDQCPVYCHFLLPPATLVVEFGVRMQPTSYSWYIFLSVHRISAKSVQCYTSRIQWWKIGNDKYELWITSVVYEQFVIVINIGTGRYRFLPISGNLVTDNYSYLTTPPPPPLPIFFVRFNLIHLV